MRDNRILFRYENAFSEWTRGMEKYYLPHHAQNPTKFGESKRGQRKKKKKK